MRTKLLLLNLALVAAIAVTGWHLRQQWIAAKAREQALQKSRIKPAAPPPRAASKPAEPVTAAPYSDIAQKMLFSKDRNPTVVVEVAPPPPPKPVPPLPALYGVMSLPDGPRAIMSEKPGPSHHGFRAGEKIGEFTLLGVDNQKIVLGWEDKVIEKKVDDMLERSAPAAPAAGESRSGAPAAPAPPPAKGEPAPGLDIGKGMRACQPGDSSPPGTVTDGMKKVLVPGPFGTSCWWEPVGGVSPK